MKDSYKKIWRQVSFLVVLLVLVLFLMTVLKNGFFAAKPAAVPDFEGKENFVDNKYLNRQYSFSVTLPATDWQLSYGEATKTVTTDFLIAPDLQRTQVLARMLRYDKVFRHDTLAVIDIGVLPLAQPTSPQSLAELCFNHFKKFYTGADSVFVTQPVSSSGSGSLTGYYFMLELAEKPDIVLPVVIPMFFVRNQTGYVIVCRSKVYGYEIVRHDFEKVLTSFRLYEASN